MDATVDDFFNEINQISSKTDSKEQLEVWQECFDELTGYSYFWNTETDEVTWVPPKSYKPAGNGSKKPNNLRSVERERKKSELFVPPNAVTAPRYSTTSVKPEAKMKVYTIQEAINKPEVKQNFSSSTGSVAKKQPVSKGPFRKPDDSDDEKIELISEYGGESDSDADETTSSVAIQSATKQRISPVQALSSSIRKTTIGLKKPIPSRHGGSHSENEEDDEDDDIDLLAKIQQRAKELKKLGGEVPPGVKHIIQNSDRKEKIDKPKVISGFSLVAGYNSGSSDSETDQPETLPLKPVFPVPPPPQPVPETSHSTLFPITKPIDVKDFIGPEPSQSEVLVKGFDNSASNNDFDSKAFQRKRRIDVSLVNSAKRPKEDLDNPNTEFTGLGFKSESAKSVDPVADTESAPGNIYLGFQKGGVMFVKSDVLNPTSTDEQAKLEKIVSKEKKVVPIDSFENSISKKETEDDYTVLREKLLFLGEGREPVLPVQVMLIQAETLFLAMKEDGLKLSYLHKWLKEMCSELIKLEKEAAPEGWLLQWDRSHKRYFYQNQATGISQWRYPEPDVTRCDDAMDICTTPPPQGLADEMEALPVSPVMFGPQLPPELPLPPSPPKIRSPTPPPPPMISMEPPKSLIPDVPLPPEPQAPEASILQPPLPPLENGQPLPPGVDLPPETYNKAKETEVKTSDTLINALDSFYSEIAEVAESTNPCSPTASAQTSEMPVEGSHDMSNTQTPEVLKKKKKKVKLAQGLTMKKKGVSQLVEKWKNVQKTYGD